MASRGAETRGRENGVRPGRVSLGLRDPAERAASSPLNVLAQGILGRRQWNLAQPVGLVCSPAVARTTHAQKTRLSPLRRVSQTAAGSVNCPSSGRRAGTASATGWTLSLLGVHVHHLLMAHAKRQPWRADRA